MQSETRSAMTEHMQRFWKSTEETKVVEEIAARDALSRLTICSIDETILLFRHIHCSPYDTLMI